MSEFRQRLDECASATGQFLAAELDHQRTGGTPGRLLSAMRHAVLGGGKRFRPFLTMECAGLFGVAAEAALTAASAVEYIHCYSLVHDDLPAMDNDEMRRGVPTVWKAYDEWTAILAGDALQALAFEVLGRTECHGDAAVRAELVLVLAQAIGAAGMVGGQALDLEAEKLSTPATPSVEHITRLQALKTGALIRAACEMGAVLGRATAEERAAICRYGDCLGFAFQISDDLLDAEGKATTVGKATGKDEAAGKATLISLLGIERARAHMDKVTADAEAALKTFGPRASALVEAARYLGRRTS